MCDYGRPASETIQKPSGRSRSAMEQYWASVG